MSEVRGSGREWQAATAQEQPRGATLCPRSGAAGRSHPVPEARGGSQEEQPHTRGRPRAVTLRSHPEPEARGGSWEEPPTPEARAFGREEQPGERWLRRRRRA